MLNIIVPSQELWDDKTQEFVYTDEQSLRLEHSLVSLSKWESKWHKPFFSKEAKTFEETLDYIRCMTLTQNVNPIVYNSLSDENISRINEYIDDPMTATWFINEEKGGFNGRQITSELIYYWMVTLKIPFECQKWHMNRLLTLIKVCNIEGQPKKNLSQREIMQRNAALNAERKKKLKTKG